jgi:hypothetical protein
MIFWTLSACAWLSLDEFMDHTDRDGDGFVAVAYGGPDCDDDPTDDPIDGSPTARQIHPGAAETWYDGIDADCAGDDDFDADKDDERHAWHGGSDCDDNDPMVRPGASELCDGRDNDCDGNADGLDDDVVDARTWYQDVDGDRFGAPLERQVACDQPTGFVELGTDCDDADPLVHPNAEEVWYDGVDQDCDAHSDFDKDFDGFTAVEGMQGTADDCDDDSADVNPAADEIWYDDIDQDCDGASDWDQDADGFTALDAPEGSANDCDDEAKETWPGAAEVWYDDIDQDCDTLSDHDQDGDGDDRDISGGTDCDDTEPSVYGLATEVCDDLDNDCDGLTDDADQVDEPTVWYRDQDEDGYGDALSPKAQCAEPHKIHVTNGQDCDDSTDEVNPDAVDACLDGVDGDCSGLDLCDWTLAPVELTISDVTEYSVASPGDMNGDGQADLAIATGVGGELALVLGPIDSTPTVVIDDRVVLSFGDNAISAPLPLGDLTGDGYRDLAAVSSTTNEVVFLLGGPSLTQVWRNPATPVRSLRAGQVLGSDDQDLFITETDGNGLHYAFFEGPVTPSTLDFTSPDATLTSTLLDSVGTSASIGDFEGDGAPDFIVTTPSLTSTHASIFDDGINGSLRGSDGDATLTIDDTDFGTFHDLAAVDLNQDGADDLVAACATCPQVWVPPEKKKDGYYQEGDGQVWVFMGPINTATTADADLRFEGNVGLLGATILVGDWNGDGKQDIGLTDETVNEDASYVFLFTGPYTSGVYDARERATAGTVAHGEFNGFDYVVTGDFNDDGQDDLVQSDQSVRLFWSTNL